MTQEPKHLLNEAPPWRIPTLEALGPETGPKHHILAAQETNTPLALSWLPSLGSLSS